MLCFYISRYARTPEQAALVHRAVASIREAHPDSPITVVDDHSPPEFDLAAPPDGRPPAWRTRPR